MIFGAIDHFKHSFGGWHPFSIAVLTSIGLCTALTIYSVVGLVASFIYHQAVGLKRLYTDLVPDAPELHIYTKKLIDNTAPELADLKRFAATGDWERFNETMDGIVWTLELQEKNRPVRDALIAQFERARVQAQALKA